MRQPLDLRDDGNRRRRQDAADAGADLKDAPWPVRAVAILGGMTVIACFLVWFLSDTVTKGLERIDANTAPIGQHIEQSRQLGETLKAIEADHRDSNRRIERYMQLDCLHGSRSEAERNICMGVDR